MSPETFPTIQGEWDIRNKIRRECRGIAFGPDGKIISRPFHKFFNVGEREDTPFLDSDYEHYTVYDKLDGSMVRPVTVGDHWRLATKAGITEVAMQAETHLKSYLREFIEDCLGDDWTPIFEYIGPDNQIVLKYPEPRLVLIGVRDNVSGEYIDMEMGAEVLSVDSIEDLLIKDAEDIEGVVIRYSNGHMLKLKSDWYVSIHRKKDLMANERKFFKLVLEDNLDDVLPTLLPDDKKEVEQRIRSLWAEVDNSAWVVETAYSYIREAYETKKEYAIATSSNPSPLRSLVFKLWDGKVDTPREAVVQYILSSMGNMDKFNEMKRVLHI